MVEGQTYSEQLFESEAFRHFINVFLNKESGITKGCEITQTSSTIEIGTGYFVIMGGLLKESTGTSNTIPTEAGYYKLVYEIDLSKVNTETSFEQGKYKFIKGVGSYPNLTQEDLDDNGNIYQFEFCQFRVTESGIQDYLDKRTFLDFDNIYKEVRKTINEIKNGSIYVTKDTINIATAIMNGTMVGADRLAKASLDRIEAQTGEKLTLENGGIKIGEGIAKVLVSAQTVMSYATGETIHFAIYKNDMEVARAVLSAPSTLQHSINITEKLINVKKGDIIYMYLRGKDVRFNGGESLTYLTVKSFS